MALGAELAVLPDGELYAGRWVVGAERWRLGNVLADARNIRWERADALAESFSKAMMPRQCQGCDWRYRCGGVDGVAAVVREGQREAGEDSLFEQYCLPRKRLFEELLWGSLEGAVNGRVRRERERIELRQDGIEFKPLPGKSPQQATPAARMNDSTA
jgi:radical SAM protein with 4Fe4S-binding SPASM domain